MNRDQWIESAEALLHLDEKKALVPHGIGGHSRTLLEEAITLLRAHNSDSAEPVAQIYRWREKGSDRWKYSDVTPDQHDREWNEIHDMEPLYLASPPAKEVEMLRKALLEIQELNTLPPDENGHRWDNSDLIAQTIMSALTNRTPDDEVGNG